MERGRLAEPRVRGHRKGEDARVHGAGACWHRGPACGRCGYGAYDILFVVRVELTREHTFQVLKKCHVTDMLCQNETPVRLTPYPDYDSAETSDSIRPLRPGPDDPVSMWGYIKELHYMFYGMKRLLETNSPLYPVVTRCAELVDEHLYLGENRAYFGGNCERLYNRLLRRFLPVYNYKTLYDPAVETYCDWIYEIFQKWKHISESGVLTTNIGRPQNLETGVSDMRNLLARLKNT